MRQNLAKLICQKYSRQKVFEIVHRFSPPMVWYVPFLPRVKASSVVLTGWLFSQGFQSFAGEEVGTRETMLAWKKRERKNQLSPFVSLCIFFLALHILSSVWKKKTLKTSLIAWQAGSKLIKTSLVFFCKMTSLIGRDVFQDLLRAKERVNTSCGFTLLPFLSKSFPRQLKSDWFVSKKLASFSLQVNYYSENETKFRSLEKQICHVNIAFLMTCGIPLQKKSARAKQE